MVLTGVKSLMEALIKVREDNYGQAVAIKDSKQQRPDTDGGSAVFRQNGHCSDFYR